MTTIFEIDLNSLAPQETFTISLSENLCKETADRFKIPGIYNIDIEMVVTQLKHTWQLTGHVISTVQLKCVQSNELFEESFNVPFDVILSQYEIEDEELDVEIINELNVDAGDIALQYLALQIPLHPTHPKLSAETHHSETPAPESSEPAWKKALEHLKQQK